jgi:hypothetical protein
MTDLQQMSRILYHHNWLRVEDWALNIERLGDLTDAEIGQLTGCAISPAVDGLRALRGARRNGRARARQQKIAIPGS